MPILTSEQANSDPIGMGHHLGQWLFETIYRGLVSWSLQKLLDHLTKKLSKPTRRARAKRHG